MAKYAPDGTLLEVLGKDEEEERLKNPEDHDRNGSGHGGRHGLSSTHGCSGIGTYEPDAPSPLNILDQLVAALHDAGLDAYLRHCCRQRSGTRHLSGRNPHEIED